MSSSMDSQDAYQPKNSSSIQMVSKSTSPRKKHSNKHKKQSKKRHHNNSDDGNLSSESSDKNHRHSRYGKQRRLKCNETSTILENRTDSEDEMRIDDKRDKVCSKTRDRYSRRDDRDHDYKRIPHENCEDTVIERVYYRNREYKRQDDRDRDNRDRGGSFNRSYNGNNHKRDRRYDEYIKTERDRERVRSIRGRDQLSNYSHQREYQEKNSERKDYRDRSKYYETRENDNQDKKKESQGKTTVGNPEKREDVKEKKNTSDLQPTEQNAKPVVSQKKVVDMLTSKTGGAYIPPAKLKMMQAQITDKSSAEYQRIAWEALKKSIHGHINKVNTGNLATIVRELLKENLVRGCGLLCRSIIQAQAASPTFTKVYAALVAVINSRFPQIGELLLKRVVIQFKRGFKRNDKSTCISSAIFIAHLVNQDVAHELLALEILVLLMENPTSDSVEVAIAFLKEVVEKLLQVAKKGTMAIQDMLRNILHEGSLDKRVQYMIEVMFQMIKVGGTKKEGEDEEDQLEGLVDEEDQITHLINLDDDTDGQDILNVFKRDPDYEANEASYKKLREEILGSDSESGEEGSDEDEDDSEDSDDEEKSKDVIIDKTETNLVALRRTIYLTIQSSLDFEECAHKLLRMQLKPGQEMEMCHMILDCCAEMRSYEKFFGLLAQRFCMINKMYVGPFQQIFIDSYATIHRLEINKLRNVAKLFAHLLFTHAISWEVLSTCRLTEEDSTSSSRIFVKILFQELSEYMGLSKLNDQLKNPVLQPALEGLFPRNDPRNTRFAINFFTSIGLGGLTDDLREHLKSQPKNPVAQLPVPADATAAPNSSSSSSSSSDSDSDSD